MKPKHVSHFGTPLARALIVAAVGLGVALAVGCHSSGDRPGRPSQRIRGDQYLIEEAELKAAAGQTLYDVVRNLRPFWVTRSVRGATGNNAVAVYLDQRLIGAMSVLREMDPRVAKSLQYLSTTEAQLRFGPSHGTRAAIVIELAK